MPTDYLVTRIGVPYAWMKLVNNDTQAVYYSAAQTDVRGLFTHTAPPGVYTAYYAQTATLPGVLDPSWQFTGNSEWVVPLGSGFKATINLDAADGGTPSVNWHPAGSAANSKLLWRMLPTGNGAYLTTGDRAEQTLGGDTTPTWWTDLKTRQRISDGVRFRHALSDSLVGVEPITQFVFEIDGSNRSTNVERFIVVRDTFIDGASGDSQVMLDIKGDTGVIGIAKSTVDLGVPLTVKSGMRLPSLPGFVAGDKYVVAAADGTLHLSAVGPAL